MGGQRDRAAAILDKAHRQTYHELDGGKIGVNTYQDVEPHLEYCAKMRRKDREQRGTFGKRPFFHQKMSLPFNMIEGIALKLGIPAGQMFMSDQQKRIMRELRKPEYKKFRTTVDKRI